MSVRLFRLKIVISNTSLSTTHLNSTSNLQGVGLLTSVSRFNCKLLRKKKTVPISVLSSDQGGLLGSGQGVIIDLGEYKKHSNVMKSDIGEGKDRHAGVGGGGGGEGDRARAGAGAGAGTGLSGDIGGQNIDTGDDPALQRRRSLRNVANYTRRHSSSCIPTSSCMSLPPENQTLTPRPVSTLESRSGSHSHSRSNDRPGGSVSNGNGNDNGNGNGDGESDNDGREGWSRNRNQRAVSVSRANQDADTLQSSFTVRKRGNTPNIVPMRSSFPNTSTKIGVNSSKSDNRSRQSSFTVLKAKLNMASGKSNSEKKKRRRAMRRKRVRYHSVVK